MTSGGRPTAARLHVIDSAGKGLRNPGRGQLARREEVNSTIDGSASVSLPVGRYHVRAENRRGAAPYPSKHLGAVDVLNSESSGCAEFDLFPMDLACIRAARQDGTFIDAEKPIWKNVPVNVAFGGVDAIGVVNNDFHPDDVWPDAEKYGSLPAG